MIELQIGGRRLGEGAACLLVAEIGSSHEGDLARARESIDAAGEAGAEAVKFQAIWAEEILHPFCGEVELPGGPVELFQRFRALERDEAFYAELKARAEKRGLLFLCSAFGPRSARMLRGLKVKAMKIASPELNHLPLLREVAGYGIPLILSTGVSLLADIEKALGVLARAGGRAGEVILHCVTAYPAPEEQYNLRLIGSLRSVFGRPVGVSDHSQDPVLVPALAASCGACLVEKHFTLERIGKGLDDAVALDEAGFRLMARAVREAEEKGREETLKDLASEYGRKRVEQVLGDGVKRLAPAEKGFYPSTRRSLHALKEIRAGEAISEQGVIVVRSEANLRPGLDPEFLEAIKGKKAARTIPAGQGITWEDLLSPP